MSGPDPRGVAVVCGERHFTYNQLWERCRRLVAALRALGLRRGARVAVVGDNCHQYLELYLAVPAAGFVLVPLGPGLGDEAIAHALRDSGATVLFTCGPVPVAVERVIGLGEEYEALLEGAAPAPAGSGGHAGSVAGLFYTGGTTGHSKGVALTNGNLRANARHLASCLPLGPATRWLIAAPMFHVSGTLGVLATIEHGGRHVVLPRFTPEAALDLAERHAATATLLVPPALAALAEAQRAAPRTLPALAHVLHGGAPIAEATLRDAAAAFPGVELTHLYGATETAPIATVLRHEEGLLGTPVIRSCGRAVPGVEVEVVDGAGGRAPVGQVGEVTVSGPNVMAGYWNRAEATAAVLTGHRYRTGDLGWLDAEGHLFLVDRAVDAIMTPAGVVASTVIEEVLYGHPAVAEAAVFASPAAGIQAVVFAREDVEAADLRARCGARLRPEHVPRDVTISREPLPKSGPGKILKRVLRERFAGDRDT